MGRRVPESHIPSLPSTHKIIPKRDPHCALTSGSRLTLFIMDGMQASQWTGVLTAQPSCWPWSSWSALGHTWPNTNKGKEEASETASSESKAQANRQDTTYKNGKDKAGRTATWSVTRTVLFSQELTQSKSHCHIHLTSADSLLGAHAGRRRHALQQRKVPGGSRPTRAEPIGTRHYVSVSGERRNTRISKDSGSSTCHSMHRAGKWQSLWIPTLKRTDPNVPWGFETSQQQTLSNFINNAVGIGSKYIKGKSSLSTHPSHIKARACTCLTECEACALNPEKQLWKHQRSKEESVRVRGRSAFPAPTVTVWQGHST